MEVTFIRADIVILGSAHNPSIISPQWLKDNSLIIEEPKNFVHTPDFSLFESESFQLIIDHQRFQIISKKQDIDSASSLSNIAGNYVKLLPHIPYKSLGLNFILNIEINKGEETPKISFNIGNSDLMLILEGHKVDFGGIIYARREPYVLKIIIEPQGENTIAHNFNYHHELAGKSWEDLVELIGNFLIRYEDSMRIVKRLYPLGEKK